MEIGFPLWAFGTGVQVLSTASFLARSKLRRRRSNDLHGERSGDIAVLDPISILKPLKGRDENLEGNLRSFFELEYPEFELLFCLESPNDSAFPVVESLIREYPRVAARVFFSASAEDLPNPKISNLRGAYLSARYDLTLIADSNIRISPDGIRNLIRAKSDRTGIVTALVRGVEAEGFAGELEAIALNTFYVRGMTLAESVGRACVLGKAMLFRRSLLDRMGGARVLGRYLAEDYMAGIGVRQLGTEIRIAEKPVDQVIGRYRFLDFWKRHLRWGRIRKVQAPFLFPFELITQTAFLAALSGTIFGVNGVVASVAMGLCLDSLTLRKLEVSWTPRRFLAWVARETIAPALGLATLFGNEVEWRGQKIRVELGGTIETSRTIRSA